MNTIDLDNTAAIAATAKRKNGWRFGGVKTRRNRRFFYFYRGEIGAITHTAEVKAEDMEGWIQRGCEGAPV